MQIADLEIPVALATSFLYSLSSAVHRCANIIAFHHGRKKRPVASFQNRDAPLGTWTWSFLMALIDGC
jgi:hypothetical protein